MRSLLLPLVASQLVLPLWAATPGAATGGPLVDSLEDIDTSGSPDGIVDLPSSVHPTITDVFARYTKILSDDGEPIHFLIHEGVGDFKVVHARRIMEQHIADLPGSQYGADKSSVRNSMGGLRATMILFPTESSLWNGGPKVDKFLDDYEAPFQDLLGEEIILPGSGQYSGSDPRRDASYEELCHLMHGYGLMPAMPALQAAIQAATSNALANDFYDPPPDLPPGDTHYEYLAFAMETWYGMWRHEPNNGEYVFSTRAEMEAGDPMIVAILEGFFPAYHTHLASVVPGFTGTFLIEETSGVEYTFKSRYLTHVELRGSKATDLRANDQDGALSGSTGDNRIEGGGGADVIDGRAGSDTAVYGGPRAEYGVYLLDGVVTVDDEQPARDGRDRLTDVEWLEFSDQTLDTSTLTDAADHYCDSTANSTGVMAEVHLLGSPVVDHGDLTLVASLLPANQYGYFLTSQTAGFVQGPGGSSGDLCLGGVIGRYASDVASSGDAGGLSLEVDLDDMPSPAQSSVQPGETWHFAAWFRDMDPDPTSNFTGGVSVLFQ